VKLRLTRESFKLLLRWTQRILFAAAFCLLSYAGFILLDAWNFQRTERLRLEELRTEQQAAQDAAPPQISTTLPATPPPPTEGQLVGQLEIARLDLSVIVVAGTTKAILRRAAGHIAGTSMPGEPGGNIGISAHRDTFFRPLRNIRTDDLITLTTSVGEHRYRVESTKVVKPNQVEVLDPDGTEVLTLVTCHPFYFVGSAPNRFIVRAKRVE
jgi:sortase A